MERVLFSTVKPNTAIKVNNELVAVNKQVLAHFSPYFERYFFDDRYLRTENIELPESTTVEDFKRIIAFLPPEQRGLDDDCIEAVLILANHFSISNMLELCRNFLMASHKLKLYKFRIAHKYGWKEMEEILDSMRLYDFNVVHFVENAMEFAMLNKDAKWHLAVRHVRLVSAIPTASKSSILGECPVVSAPIARRPSNRRERKKFSKAKPDTTIRVNNEEVAVNKQVLANSSVYFDRYFFDDRYPPAENIELPPSTTVEDFKRMVAVLPPEKRQLDDDCFEAVIILADRFFMDAVTTKCQNFLMACNKPVLFKFRIAHKYGWSRMKERILQMKLDDFGGENFLENANEFAMLDDEGKAAIVARHAELVAKETERIGIGGRMPLIGAYQRDVVFVPAGWRQ